MKSLNHLSRRYVSMLCAIALIATSFAHAFAQQPTTTKRPITHRDYDTWHSIQSPQISRDGKFVAYAYMAQDEDSEIVARNAGSSIGARRNSSTSKTRMVLCSKDCC